MSIKQRLARAVATAIGAASLVSAHADPAATPGTAAAVPEGGNVASSTAAFGLSLMQNPSLSEKKKNVFISPFSISQALSLALNGAGGETQAQIRKTLCLGDVPLEEINKENGKLLPSLKNPDPKVTLSIANALWVNKGETLDAGFQQRCHDFYQAESATLDFSTPSGADTINAWVDKNTQGKITKIVSQAMLQSSPAVLTNAIYFHGQWTDAFAKTNTHDADFTLADGSKKKLPMMVRNGSYSYLATDTFQAVRLPYGKGRIAMYVFLPKASGGLDDFIKSATPSAWDSWMKQMHGAQVSVYLPRFKANYDVTLNDALSAMGMPLAFSQQADFAPMGLPKDFIGAVIHKATLEVDEEGTVAAAATAVVMARAALVVPTEIRIDHPFFCAIRDDTTGALLFAGAIRNPE